jgi:pimeloyl-ACP methyl ester carboxylesterase
VVVVDVRGRGRSDVPESGYTWEHHISDVRATVETLGLDRPIVVAFSRGSSYGLGYALTYPGDVRGLVVGDYFARHVGLPPEIADQQLQSKVRGTVIAERMSEHAVRQVVAESREVPLWDRLVELQCPVLVIRGGRKSALVGDELAAQWRASLPSVQMELIADAGHDLWSRDVDAYLAVLLPFLEGVSSTT